MTSRPFQYPPAKLTDGSIAIRRWLETDVDCVRQASLDPTIPPGTTVPADYTVERGIAFIHRQWSRATEGVGVSQAIVEAGSDRAIGLIIVSARPQDHVAGLGYWIVPGARGRGAAIAAVRLVVRWALDALDLQRLEAWTAPDNAGSRNVLTKAGFQEEGRLRNFLSGPADAMVYSVIRP
jgi:ribosomal-protein-alanine N-acetyltransferase